MTAPATIAAEQTAPTVALGAAGLAVSAVLFAAAARSVIRTHGGHTLPYSPTRYSGPRRGQAAWMIGAFGMIVLELVGARRHLWGVAWGVAALLGVVLLTRSHARHR